MDKHTVMRFSAIDTRTGEQIFFRRESHFDLSEPRDMFTVMQNIILGTKVQGFRSLMLESFDVLGEGEQRW